MSNIILDFIKFRENQGLTQTELADKLSVSRSTIAKIENGNSKISKKLLLKLEDSFPNEWEYFDKFRNELIETKSNKDLDISENDKKALKEIYISYDIDSILHYYLRFPKKELEKILLFEVDELKQILESNNLIFDIFKTLNLNNSNVYYEDKFSKVENVNNYIQKCIIDSLPEENKFSNKNLIVISKIINIEREKEHFTKITNIYLKYLKNYVDFLSKTNQLK